jgi:hypothetical protein
MRIFTELLFQHGHIADVALAQRLAEPDTAVEPMEPVAAESVGSAATPARHVHTEAATTQQIRREPGMARLSRRLLRAMTALSPFR